MSYGLPCEGLTAEQCKQLQRFMPNNLNEDNFNFEDSKNDSIYNDVNGFFIAKFSKILK
jgi:hypothetical protein